MRQVLQGERGAHRYTGGAGAERGYAALVIALLVFAVAAGTWWLVGELVTMIVR